MIALGCIADDFTGAADAASYLAKGGLQTCLISGVPETMPDLSDAEAVVIALKTRTQLPCKRCVPGHLCRFALPGGGDVPCGCPVDAQGYKRPPVEKSGCRCSLGSLRGTGIAACGRGAGGMRTACPMYETKNRAAF